MINSLRSFFLLILTFLALGLVGQEICDNGVDDDNDGLIDLNDADCACAKSIPSSLIPNPSFEERTCCPNGGELECAVDWIQASLATSDYFHTCGLTRPTWLGYGVPSPLPDGNGYIGFRDGKPGQPNFKEYVGACLTDAMEVGVKYRLEFFLGFPTNAAGFDYIDLTIFGTNSCNNIPFGQSSTQFGCPTNGEGWQEVVSERITGDSEWQLIELEFVAEEPYESIVIGPGCQAHEAFARNPYFFADRLALAKAADFEVSFASIKGSPCEDNIEITADQSIGTSYQWYKDGVAIVGQTGLSIDISVLPDAEGIYEVLIIEPDGCFRSQKYELKIPDSVYREYATICKGDVFPKLGDDLEVEGVYRYELTDVEGCDSIVELELTVELSTYGEWEDQFCSGDIYTYESNEFSDPGVYEVMLTGSNGCDSIVKLTLLEVDYEGEVSLVPEVEVNLGESLNLSPIIGSPDLNSFLWVNGEGVIISEDSDLVNYFPFMSEVLTFQLEDSNNCGIESSTQVRVNRVLDIRAPNIFSPNGDGVNETFAITFNKAITNVKSLIILDRWGNAVHKVENVSKLDYQGWDGRFNGKEVAEGVYLFFAELVALDGVVELVKGDVTIIR